MDKQEAREIVETFRVNTQFAIDTSTTNEDTKELLRELMKQTFYAIDAICEKASKD